LNTASLPASHQPGSIHAYHLDCFDVIDIISVLADISKASPYCSQIFFNRICLVLTSRFHEYPCFFFSARTAVQINALASDDSRDYSLFPQQRKTIPSRVCELLKIIPFSE
jgi:hypothetical protein